MPRYKVHFLHKGVKYSGGTIEAPDDAAAGIQALVAAAQYDVTLEEIFKLCPVYKKGNLSWVPIYEREEDVS